MLNKKRAESLSSMVDFTLIEFYRENYDTAHFRIDCS